jgi:hypothetical protein
MTDRAPSLDPDQYDLVADGDAVSRETAELPEWFSPQRTTISPPENLRLALAFEHLEQELARLAPRWLAIAPIDRIAAIVFDFEGFMRILLDDVEFEPIWTRSGETNLLVHDTYVRLICVAGVLREAIDEHWASEADLVSAYAHAGAVLDAFAPFVGISDRAMRRICLEGETLDVALRWLARELDEEAAERARQAEAYIPHAAPRHDEDN